MLGSHGDQHYEVIQSSVNMEEPSAHSMEQKSRAYLHSCCRFLQNISTKPRGNTRLNLQLLATVTSTLDMHITTYTTHCSAHLTLL